MLHELQLAFTTYVLCVSFYALRLRYTYIWRNVLVTSSECVGCAVETSMRGYQQLWDGKGMGRDKREHGEDEKQGQRAGERVKDEKKGNEITPARKAKEEGMIENDENENVE